jgi:hypothetical protein
MGGVCAVGRHRRWRMLRWRDCSITPLTALPAAPPTAPPNARPRAIAASLRGPQRAPPTAPKSPLRAPLLARGRGQRGGGEEEGIEHRNEITTLVEFPRMTRDTRMTKRKTLVIIQCSGASEEHLETVSGIVNHGCMLLSVWH